MKKNKVFWPQLPSWNPSDFNQNAYANLLLAEGDSWFAWGYLNLKPSPNVLTSMTFNGATATLSYAYSGDTIDAMAKMSSNVGFYQEISARRFKAILLSGGGNDLFAAVRQGHILKRPKTASQNPDDYINWEALDRLRDYVDANYRRIISWRKQSLSMNKTTPFVLYTYDYPMPRNAKAQVGGFPAVGTWLHEPLTKVAKSQLHFEITQRIVDKMAMTIQGLHNPTDGIHVVNTLGALTPADQSSHGDSMAWANEIHPNVSGYGKIAALLCQRLGTIGIT